jgi:sacsin
VFLLYLLVTGRLRSIWNQVLLEEIIAPTYATLLLSASQVFGFSDDFLKLWPSVNNTAKPWSSIVLYFYKNIVNMPLFYSSINNGSWLLLNQVFVLDQNQPNYSKFHSILLKEGLPMASINQDILTSLNKLGINANYLTADKLREKLLQPGTHPHISNISDTEILLQYFLTEFSERLDKLVGLQLIPLWNGQVEKFSVLTPNYYFVKSQEDLEIFSGIKQCIVKPDLPSELSHLISTLVGIEKATNLKYMNFNHFLTLLPVMLPVNRGSEDIKRETISNITNEWLSNVWKYIVKNCKDSSELVGWLLLPTQDGYLVKVSKQSKVIR